MSTEAVILNGEIHELLKKLGYSYFVITQVLFKDQETIYSITVKAKKELPPSMKNSCTGIDDPMITSFIYKKGLNCEIFIEPFE